MNAEELAKEDMIEIEKQCKQSFINFMNTWNIVDISPSNIFRAGFMVGFVAGFERTYMGETDV